MSSGLPTILKVNLVTPRGVVAHTEADSVQAPGQTGQAGAFVMLVLVATVLPMVYYVRVTLRGDEVRT